MMFVDFFLTIKWTYLIFNVAVLVFNFSEAYFLIERMNAWSIMLNVSNNMYWRICQCNYCLFIIDNFDYWPFEYNRASTFRTFLHSLLLSSSSLISCLVLYLYISSWVRYLEIEGPSETECVWWSVSSALFDAYSFLDITVKRRGFNESHGYIRKKQSI